MREDKPLFNAVTSSARQLQSLLKCIAFTQKAQVFISADGLRFSTAESSVMEGIDDCSGSVWNHADNKAGHAFLDKKLFSTFQYNGRGEGDEDGTEPHIFEINLLALLETLQILVFASDSQSYSGSSRFQSFNKPPSAFSAATLGLSSLCTITYPEYGEPLTIILTENNVETKCELTTYEPAQIEDIPFARDMLAAKVIMRGEWLADAISELAATSPEYLTIETGPGKIGFRLRASGPVGSAEVEFEKIKGEGTSASFSHPTPGTAVPPANTSNPGVLETFLVQARNVNSYKFSMVRAATLAMKQAMKVSIRVDDQGVLSLQFMIEIDTGSGNSENELSFVDYRFVPLVLDDVDEEDGDDGERDEGSSTDDA